MQESNLGSRTSIRLRGLIELPDIDESGVNLEILYVRRREGIALTSLGLLGSNQAFTAPTNGLLGILRLEIRISFPRCLIVH